jgi:hypothetical protein
MADSYPPRQASDTEDEEQPPRESVSAKKRSDEEKHHYCGYRSGVMCALPEPTVCRIEHE